ncbi:hypothetical protein F4808DRAFT_458261 [Astrocystis sublimbata]|nr:hypothetical protein F4808DRAFT_458261 [Astrocystis sublimbata]
MQLSTPLLSALIVASSSLLGGASAAAIDTTTSPKVLESFNDTVPMVIQSIVLPAEDRFDGKFIGRMNSYAKSCTNMVWLQPAWPPDVWFQAYCPNRQGISALTVINLNRCIANRWGTMVPAADGNFGLSCQRNYWKMEAGIKMTVECDGPDGVVRSSLNLDDFIHNDDGQLHCFDYHGCSPYSRDCRERPPFL